MSTRILALFVILATPVCAQLGPDRVFTSGITCPEIASDDRGTSFVAYTLLGTDAVAVARSLDAGETWAAPTPIGVTPARDVVIATDRSGGWVVCWTRTDADEIRVSRSTDDGNSWSPETVLHAGGTTTFSSLVWDGAGRYVLVFSELIGGVDTDVRVKTSSDGVAWTAAVNIDPFMDTDFFFDFHPSVAAAGDGRVIATWTSGSLGAVQSATSNDGGLTWSAPTFVLGLAATGAGVAARGDRCVVVCGGSFLAPFLVGFTSDDFGVTWQPQVTVDPAASTQISHVRVATDGAGNWLATWAATPPGAGVDLDVLLSRSADAGKTWTLPVTVNSDHATDVHPDVPGRPVSFGTGTFVLPYTDADGFDARSRRLDLCGVLGPVAPGTGEDLAIASTINGLGCPLAGVKPARPGDLVVLAFWSPGATFDGLPGALLVQATLADTLPPSPFPGIAVNPAVAPGVAVFLDGAAIPPGGRLTGFVMPAGLQGIDLLLQAFALTPTAANGIFASTPAHVIRGS